MTCCFSSEQTQKTDRHTLSRFLLICSKLHGNLQQ